MRTATITLNGKKYEIQEKRRKENRAWREKLEVHFADIKEVLNTDIDTTQGLSSIVGVLSAKIVGSVDIVCDLVADYAPDLPLDDVYESDIVEVFWTVLGLAYPFGFEKVLNKILGLVQSGLEQQSTTQS